MARTRLVTCGTPMALMLLSAPAPAAPEDPSSTLSRLVGHSKAELIQRFGQPADTVATIDGERLFYETLDAGRVGGISGRNTRAGGPGDFGLFPRTYSFRCKTEVVIADGRVRAFNRTGNDCH
jgi:hypothetical protein